MSTQTWAIMNVVSFFGRPFRVKTDPMNHEIGRCKSIFCLILSLHSLISKSQNRTINIGSLLFILESTKSVVGLKIYLFHVWYMKKSKVSVFEPWFQLSSNIQQLRFHFYERVLGWRIYSDFQKYRILVDEQHVLAVFAKDMFFPIHREV